MSVGIILEAQQAEAVLEKGQAVLIGRPPVAIQSTIAHHWAHDLGTNRRFEDWSPEFGWWLESGSGPWKVLQRRLALSRGALEA